MHYTFEFFHTAGKQLFAPVNNEARELCLTMRRKNLTVNEVIFYSKQGHTISLQPRIDLPEELQGFLNEKYKS